MPVLDGFGAAMQIRQQSPDTPILFFTMHNGPAFVNQTRRMGVQGLVSKDRAGEMLVDAVKALLQHNTYFPESESRLRLT